ncbi:TonB-dependent siderophore receptor [Paracoccus caeni]|uniref:TonB-dependent siderophore receptor n=1 Tax=Paracoccus caeni TaxID=657651 RepID=A0A934VXM1_9RHOB|nr:TonB-dependent siderophore receptor [Paracoccus caeni]MBK4215117.1 TonB-dependent siderophore receptor [Paracoccus caeni]
MADRIVARAAALLLTTAITTLLAQPAMAQDGAAQDGAPTVLQTITLNAEGDTRRGDQLFPEAATTGTKTATPVAEVPQAISVVPRAQFEAQSADLVTEALRYAPGILSESNGYDIRYDWYWVRGQAASGMWQDGLQLPSDPSSYANPAIDPYTLERVELIKGPASVLYGQTVPGGLVNLVSKRPEWQASRSVNVKTSSYGGLQTGIDLTGPVAGRSDLAYRLTGLYHNMGSQVDQERSRHLTFAPSLTWTPDDRTTITAYAHYRRDRDDFSPRFYPAHGTLLPNPAGDIPRDLFLGDPAATDFNRDFAAVGYELEHRLDTVWTLRQNLRYARSAQDMFLVLVNPAFAWPGDFPGTPGAEMNRVTAASDDELRNLAVDSQAEARFSTGAAEHTLLIGVDYNWSRFSGKFGNSAPGVVPGLDFTDPQYGLDGVVPPAYTTSVLQTRKQLGLYAQDQIRAGAWITTLGLRYDRSEIDTINRLAGDQLTQTDDNALTGRIGVAYQFQNGVMPYAAYSTSFNPTLGTNAAGDPFEARSARQFELGVKYQQPETENLFTATLFTSTEDNVLTPDPDPANARFSVQDGEQRARGLELEAKFALTPQINVIAAYAYTDSEVLSSNDSRVVGQDMLRLPRHQGGLWVQYNDAFTPGLSLSAGLRGTSSYQSAPTYLPELEIPGRGLVDLGIRYDLAESPWRVEGAVLQLNAANVFDKRFVAQCLNLTGGSCNYGEGRSIEASFGYTW